MKGVGGKPETLRQAVARASLKAPDHCLARVADRDTDKGDPQDTARVAGIMAAKRTDVILPLCHPMPLQQADVEFAVESDRIVVTASVETIAPTGVEMEALTAANVAALTLYDMLKPYCEPSELGISDCHLVEKTGGKSQHKRRLRFDVGAAVIVTSDAIAAGSKTDAAGSGVAQELRDAGFTPLDYQILAADADAITAAVEQHIEAGTPLIVTVGGTGLGAGDVTVDIVRPFIDSEIPGLMETARAFGQRRTPNAMLSRGIAGMAGQSLVVTFPGSRTGAAQTLAALLPGLIHIFEVRRGRARAQGHR